MNPFALGLAAATLAALAASSPLLAATGADRQPVTHQWAIRQTTPPHDTAQWPVSPATIVRLFEPHEEFGPGHRGVDLAAIPGQGVSAAIAGQILVVGTVAGRPVVVVQHNGGLRTTYLPVAASVAVGTHVDAGQPIGSLAVGMHCPISTCLHWGARLGNEYVDPLTLMGREVVLLPAGSGWLR
ncbi:MAG: M23 family metallopeptidase [Actinomycetia bacterium]|nr:M23 family metallopeptidase [Actinomycetes bacterium]